MGSGRLAKLKAGTKKFSGSPKEALGFVDTCKEQREQQQDLALVSRRGTATLFGEPECSSSSKRK